MRKAIYITLIIALFLAGCQSTPATGQGQKKTIVVTYSILGALVKELVGDQADVVVLIPNGQDPHEWEPSAKDIEILMKADLIIQNGLGLEGGLEKTLSQAAAARVKSFVTTDHITVRKVGRGEGIPNGGADQTVGAPDPHIWTDPLTMKQVSAALADQINTDLGLDVSAQARDQQARLDKLNVEITKMVDSLPASNRKLVTGHESLGYFAQRFGSADRRDHPQPEFPGGGVCCRYGCIEDCNPGKPGEGYFLRDRHPHVNHECHRCGDRCKSD